MRTPYSHRKPVDDGCTVVVNILYDGYLINCNVGDSRSLLLKKELPDDAEWEPCFASRDHNPAELDKAFQIHRNGGRFMNNGRTIMNVEMYLQEAVQSVSKCVQPLVGTRIGRQLGWNVD